MNRRQVLTALLSAVPLVAAGLLMPRKTFFLPPAGGWNTAADDVFLKIIHGWARQPLGEPWEGMELVYRFDVDAQIYTPAVCQC